MAKVGEGLPAKQGLKPLPDGNGGIRLTEVGEGLPAKQGLKQ